MIIKTANIVIVLLVFYHFSFGQTRTENTNPFISVETFFVFPYYFSHYESQFNYGFGAEVSENFTAFKITTGLFLTTKEYSELFESTSDISKISYSLDYINIPILLGFPLVKDKLKLNQFLIRTGIIINIPMDYQSSIYYKNNNATPINTNSIAYKAGSSLRLAFQYQRVLNKSFNTYVGVFGDYKFKLDHVDFNNSTPQWHSSIADDRLSIGINIGIEWFYKRD